MEFKKATYELGEQLSLDFQRRQLKCGDKVSEMTPHEYKILKYLITQHPDSSERQQLCDVLWPGDKAGVDTKGARLRSLFSQLYKKLREFRLREKDYIIATSGFIKLQQEPRLATTPDSIITSRVSKRWKRPSLSRLQAVVKRYYPNQDNFMKLSNIKLPYARVWSTTEIVREDQIRYVQRDMEYRLCAWLEPEREERIRWFKEISGKKKIDDPNKARLYALNSDTKNRKLMVEIQDTSYYKTIVTNFTLDFPGASFSTREALAPNGHLPALDKEVCSDHIGVNVLGMTRDCELVLARRSQSVSIASGCIDFLGAGSADALTPDFDLFSEAWREFGRETGVKRTEVKPGLVLLGCARNLYYGGKPEFFFLAITTHSFKRLREIFIERDPPEREETAVDKKGRPIYYKVPFFLPKAIVLKKLVDLVKKQDLSSDLRAGLCFLWEFYLSGQIKRLFES